MKCREAQAALEGTSMQPGSPGAGGPLHEHLQSCRTCGEMSEQLDRTWTAMSAYPSIEPSPDFLPRFHRLLQTSEPHQGGPWIWRPVMGWQWMALVASVVIVCFLLISKSPPHPAMVEAAMTGDQMDEKLLQDVEQSLNQTDVVHNYLSVYDEWEGIQLENSPQNLPAGRATERKKTS